MAWQVTWQPLHRVVVSCKLLPPRAAAALLLPTTPLISHAHRPMPFKPTETDKEWKARLKKMQDDATQTIRVQDVCFTIRSPCRVEKVWHLSFLSR